MGSIRQTGGVARVPREGRAEMAVVVLELDEEFQVAMARTLVEAPHSALIAAADPNSRAGHIAAADSYEEAIAYGQGYVDQGWRVVVWQVPASRDSR